MYSMLITSITIMNKSYIIEINFSNNYLIKNTCVTFTLENGAMSIK